MNSTKKQIGGTHYTKLAIQPVEYIHKNGLGFIEGCVIKYMTRWRDKNGVEDLQKAKHFIELLIEMEQPETPKPKHSRIDVIGQNGNDGDHYSETDTFYSTEWSGAL